MDSPSKCAQYCATSLGRLLDLFHHLVDDGLGDTSASALLVEELRLPVATGNDNLSPLFDVVSDNGVVGQTLLQPSFQAKEASCGSRTLLLVGNTNGFGTSFLHIVGWNSSSLFGTGGRRCSSNCSLFACGARSLLLGGSRGFLWWHTKK